MPELPDITIYLEALQRRVLGRVLARARILSPFLLRTAAPPIASLHGKKVVDLRRLGKRVALGFENGSWLVLHLMIAGRLHWIPLVVPPNGPAKAVRSKGRNAKMPGAQALFEFDTGVLVLTEAGTKRRASLHVLPDEAALQALNPGGLEIMGSALDQFAQVLTSQNHTLKRALTDPRLLSGIGNAYSDEILHRAQLSPVMLTQRMSPEEISRLRDAVRGTLIDWTDRL